MPSSFKSPLSGFEHAEPLPDTINADGKSLYNPPAPLSKVYETFPEPFTQRNNGFDFHSASSALIVCVAVALKRVVYFMQSVPSEVKYAKELHERIRREFPEMRIYKVFERPVGTCSFSHHH